MSVERLFHGSHFRRLLVETKIVLNKTITITSDELREITTLTERRHQQIADEGFFPAPVDGKYQLVPTMAGMIRFYREHNQRMKGRAGEAKDEKTRKESRLLDLKIAKEERKTANIADVDALHLHLSTFVKTILYQRLSREMGPKCAGKTAEEINIFGRAAAGEICELLRHGIEQWKEEADAGETVAR